MLAEPAFRCIDHIRALPGKESERPWVIELSPQGRPFDHAKALELSGRPWLTLLCGRYERFDQRVRDAGVEFEWKVGREITEADWRFFVRCYDNTYSTHHATPYLNLDFFLRIGAAMPDNLLLVLGRQDGKPLCASLDSPHRLGWPPPWGLVFGRSPPRRRRRNPPPASPSAASRPRR